MNNDTQAKSAGKGPGAPGFLTTQRRGEVHRWSRVLIATAREAPADAEVPSHALMARAGMIRRVGAGVYDYLPLAWRVITKIQGIIREELDAAGCCEFLMPAMEPIELLRVSGRDAVYGDNLFRLTDRHGREFGLAPTHEEVITELMKGSITSYKQLPLTLYQIQTKFRDEFRPRAGLLRGREFIMKDAYSFHVDVEGPGGLNETYDALHRAYSNTFRRCGLDFTICEAESGPIGGSASHEFMVNCANGEDTILVCPASGYAANVEKCEIGPRPWSAHHPATGPITEHHTPGLPGIEGVAQRLGTTPSGMLKAIVMQPGEGVVDAGHAWVLAVVRGDHEVNEGKVRDAAGFAVRLADEKAARAAGFAIGYVSPRAAARVAGTLLLIDPDAINAGSWATGSDRADHHDTGFNWAREMGEVVAGLAAGGAVIAGMAARVADIRNAAAGDPSPRADGARLEARRGIEVGHIFKLGDKYSRAFDFGVLDPSQKRRHVIMGCYGIGVSRTMAACVEMSHDQAGIVWPAPIAPYHAVITMIKPEDRASQVAAESAARGLADAGCDVLIDDRDERPGVKFKDADLIGIPVRVVIGPKTLEQGGAEVKRRRDTDAKGDLVPMAELVPSVLVALGA